MKTEFDLKAIESASVGMGDLVLDANGIWRTSRQQEIAYPSTGNAHSLSLESESFWFNYRNSVILQTIGMFPFSGAFVDIGGGNGYQLQCVARHFQATSFVLVEPRYEGCLNATHRGMTEVFNVEFHEFPFGRFNPGGIGLFDVLEHIEDDVAFLRTLGSCCGPGTRMYVTVPAHNWLWSDRDDYGSHYRRYTKASLGELARRADLKVVWNTYFFSYLVPLTLFLRAFPYRLGRKRNSTAILPSEASDHKPG